MPSSPHNGFLVGVITLAMVIGLAVRLAYRHSDLPDKPVNGALQGIELAHRSTPLAEPIVLMSNSDAGSVIGVPINDAHFPNDWIAASLTKYDG